MNFLYSMLLHVLSGSLSIEFNRPNHVNTCSIICLRRKKKR